MGKVILVLSLMCFILIGCWDRVEIEERGFVIGIAIDASETEGRYVLTYQFVVPKALQNQGGSGGGGGGEKAFINVSSEGESMFEISRMISSKVSRTPFFEHMKSIVISEKVAKTDQFAKILDFFIRDHEMRSSIKVIISKDEAGKMLEVKAQNEQMPIQYIVSISENDYKTARMPSVSRIGDVYVQLNANKSFILQRITKGDDEVKIAGSAVISGEANKMIGYLGEEETGGVKFLTDDIQGWVIKFKFNGGFNGL